MPSDFFRALVSKETWGEKRREKIPPKFPFLEFSHEQRGERGRAVCQRFRALGPKPQADELLMEPGEGECRGAMSEAGCEVVLGNVKVTLNASLLVKSVRWWEPFLFMHPLWLLPPTNSTSPQVFWGQEHLSCLRLVEEHLRVYLNLQKGADPEPPENPSQGKACPILPPPSPSSASPWTEHSSDDLRTGHFQYIQDPGE